MPKSLRKSVPIVAMVAALCVVVVAACYWRPLLAHWYYFKLRRDAEFSREAMGAELSGWRQDGLATYLQTDGGGRLLRQELLAAVLKECQGRRRQGLPESAAFVELYADMHGDMLYGRTKNRVPCFGVRVQRDAVSAARLRRLFSNAALVPGLSTAADGTVLVEIGNLRAMQVQE